MSNKFYEGCVFHYNAINEYNISGGETKMVLMSHPLYFLQNIIRHFVTNFIDKRYYCYIQYHLIMRMIK